MEEFDKELLALGERAKTASLAMSRMTTSEKNAVLVAIAEALEQHTDQILSANQKDLEAAKEAQLSESFQERLLLTEDRVAGMADGLRQMAALPDPLATVDREWVSSDGLRITQRRVPLGVIGIIYESRPNVTIDASGLCLKAGNVVILRGGSDAIHSNQQLVDIVQATLREKNYDPNMVQLVSDTSREIAGQLMRLNQYLDCLIPRGGAGLIKRVVSQATVPVIETGTGNCHLYVHDAAHFEDAKAILNNGKLQRNSVCNALETLLVDESLVDQLPSLVSDLIVAGVEIRGDEATCAKVKEAIPATEEDYQVEFLDAIIAVKVVSGVDQAIEHIRTYSSHHSDAIVTENYSVAQQFMDQVDSAVVYVNASTRFTDGEKFGLGGEIGISTQKLHARGPMGLEALTSYKYTVQGHGQVRQ